MLVEQGLIQKKVKLREIAQGGGGLEVPSSYFNACVLPVFLMTRTLFQCGTQSHRVMKMAVNFPRNLVPWAALITIFRLMD